MSITPQIALVPGSKLPASEDADLVSDLQGVAAALQIQVDKHFSPAWNIDATIGYFDDFGKVPAGFWPIIITHAPNRGDEYFGYHLDDKNQPYAIINYRPGWTLTASHELLEMLVDPSGNRLIAGPSVDKDKPDDQVRYLLEVCDPVEDSEHAYSINGFVVCNFFLPQYHSPSDSANDRYDYLGKLTAPRQVLPGGYISWEDLTDGKIYQKSADASGKEKIALVGSGVFTGAPSIREAVNKITPSPSNYYHPDCKVARTARERRQGVAAAAKNRHERLAAFISNPPKVPAEVKPAKKTWAFPWSKPPT